MATGTQLCAENGGKMPDMTAEEWIAAFAAELGRPAPTRAQIDELLKLASAAAHASERRAAPIACWLAASAGVEPGEALAIAGRVGSP
jgi:hypothetical protein